VLRPIKHSENLGLRLRRSLVRSCERHPTRLRHRNALRGYSHVRRWHGPYFLGVGHNTLNQLVLISNLKVATESADVEVAIVVAPEEEGHMQKIRFEADIAPYLSRERMRTFLLEWMRSRTEDHIHLLGYSC
jgi:hypothetical protein